MNKFMFFTSILLFVCGLCMLVEGVVYVDFDYLYMGILYVNLGAIWLVIYENRK